ncbi:hypothetical protein MNBD_CHLOROFLEXI01-2436, partial [hydrothermal vent metagenome]
AAGIFRDVDPAHVAQILVAMIFGLVTSSEALDMPILLPENGATVLLDIFYRGIEV